MFSNAQSLKAFFSRQARQIKEEGVVVVRRKIKTLLQRLAKLFLRQLNFILVGSGILLVRILKPIVLIRFGHIRSGVIGHNVFDPEYYLSEKEIINSKGLDFFYFKSKEQPNEQWSLMVKRYIWVKEIFRLFDELNRRIPGWELHHKVAGIPGSRDLNGLLSRTKPHIRFTSKENIRGSDFLKELGLKPEDRFVCLIVRDSAYKEEYQKWGNRDWSYHNYRDSDIDTYNEAVLALVEKGYFVFRMGKTVKNEFKVDHPHILDYANSEFRSDFLDIWLMANCFFCISTSTGLDEVSRVFRKPAVYVNRVPLFYIVSYDNCITVPKYLVWKNSGKKLSASEHFSHSYLHTEKYTEKGIQLKALSSKEIAETVLEFEARLTSDWVEEEKDLQFQNRFWELLQTSPQYSNLHNVIHPEARIGTEFLRNNHEWFLK